jgi:hypothetical protein
MTKLAKVSKKIFMQQHRTHLKNHVTTLELLSVLSTGLGLFGV